MDGYLQPLSIDFKRFFSDSSSSLQTPFQMQSYPTLQFSSFGMQLSSCPHLLWPYIAFQLSAWSLAKWKQRGTEDVFNRFSLSSQTSPYLAIDEGLHLGLLSRRPQH